MAQLVSLAFVVVAGLVGIDDPPKEMPPGVKRYFEEMDRQKNEQIASLESQINNKKTDAVTKKKLKRGLEAMKTSTASLIPPTITPSKFAVGQVGTIALDPGHAGVVVAAPGASRATSFAGSSAKQLRVLHIINAKEMLIEMYWYQGRSPVESTSNPFWVKGIDTKPYTTNAKISLDGVFYVSRTTSYDTDAGKMTVFVIEPVDLKPWLKSQ